MAMQVVDVEWKFGVTAANSEQNQVGTTYVHLKFVADTGQGNVKNYYIELTLPQFYSFLHELEKAKGSLNYLS